MILDGSRIRKLNSGVAGIYKGKGVAFKVHGHSPLRTGNGFNSAPLNR
jgi:hypothetical protein